MPPPVSISAPMAPATIKPVPAVPLHPPPYALISAAPPSSAPPSPPPVQVVELQPPSSAPISAPPVSYAPPPPPPAPVIALQPPPLAPMSARISPPPSAAPSARNSPPPPPGPAARISPPPSAAPSVRNSPPPPPGPAARISPPSSPAPSARNSPPPPPGTAARNSALVQASGIPSVKSRSRTLKGTYSYSVWKAPWGADIPCTTFSLDMPHVGLLSDRENGGGSSSDQGNHNLDADERNEAEAIGQTFTERNRCIRLSIVLGMLFLFHLAMLGMKWITVAFMEGREAAAAWSVVAFWSVLFCTFMFVKIRYVDKAYGLVRTEYTEGLHTVLHTAAFAVAYGFEHTHFWKVTMYSSVLSHVVSYAMEVVGAVIIQKLYNTDASPDATDFL